ncbi:MAG: DUF4434 domain-containing protein [Verrucomicrobiae bacterium]|nr:DUF4434 domain-containing protein [Verrucomicrobiae bacterium]
MKLYLTINPPGPVTDLIELEVRWTVVSESRAAESVQVMLELDGVAVGPGERLILAAGQVMGRSSRFKTHGLRGTRSFRLTATIDGGASEFLSREVVVVPSKVRSTLALGGAWVGLHHWSETEGRYWNDELARFDEEDWRNCLRGMKAIGLNTVIIQETWRNQVWYGHHYHQMTAENYRETYAGRAFYPSAIWPGRMNLPCNDPIEAILDEADRQHMQVFLGLGLYAHFDYTPGSLAWHLDVLRELWSRYGQHRSLEGWYVSEELKGWIKPHEQRYWHRTDGFREEVITFFEVLHGAVRDLAPHTLLMLAPDSYHHEEATEVWQKVLPHCDIVCIQGYQRRPPEGVPVRDCIRRMQDWCDAAGSHHWMDFEIFGFEHPDKAGPQREGSMRILPDGSEEWIQTPLIPQTIELVRQELAEFNAFEFICAYQYPGLLCAPGARRLPGGRRAIELYEQYLAYRNQLRSWE